MGGSLALPAPFGWPAGTPISLRLIDPSAPDGALAECVAGFGCPEFIIPRVIACLRASGRYDCRVTLLATTLEEQRDFFLAYGLDLRYGLDEHNPWDNLTRRRLRGSPRIY